jgi:hypothetical protein
MCGLRHEQRLLVVTIGSFIIILYVLFAFTAIYAQNQVVFVVFDSCSYEVARDINKLFLNNTGYVAFSYIITNVTPSSYYIILATNTSLQSEIGRVLKIITNSNAHYIGTSILSVNNNIISHEDLWSYCLYGDLNALKRIFETIIIREETPKSTPLLPLIIGTLIVASITVFSISQISQSSREKITTIFKKPLILLLLTLLRFRIRSENILEHPIRRTIYEKVISEKVVPISTLMKISSRAVLEWHLSVLVRAGIIREIRVVNKRFIIDPKHLNEALSKLVKIDPRIECILREIHSNKTTIEEISKKCRIDDRTAHTIVNLISQTS